jgi:hypothetical protein
VARIPTRYRKWVIIAIAVVVAVFTLPAAIDHFAHTNLVESLVHFFLQRPIPNADPNRFAILVANLGNDQHGEYKQEIIQDLEEINEIQVLSLDREINLEGNEPQRIREEGHKQAKKYLEKSNAQIVIWGTVLKDVPKLFWTTSSSVESRSGRYSLASDTQRLPEFFWKDFGDILKLVALDQFTVFEAQRGSYVADRLVPFINRARNLLKARKPTLALTDRVDLILLLSGALNTYGDQSGRNEPLLEEIQWYHEAVKENAREREPLQWAAIQYGLSNALTSLGERESGTERLGEAVDACREALKEFTRSKTPLGWAATQNNLGSALVRLGERERGTERLEQAVAAFREALKERTRVRVPLDWAITQYNLGNTLLRLGARESGTEHLEEAVAAYREALEVVTPETSSRYFGMIKQNMMRAEELIEKRKSSK